jgi:hypothetical protein
MKIYRRAEKRIDVSVGESVRIIRELQGYSQNELARLTGIPLNSAARKRAISPKITLQGCIGRPRLGGQKYFRELFSPLIMLAL